MRRCRILGFVYVLRSTKNSRLYTGSTNELVRRIAEHQRGKAPSTRHLRPLVLVHTEEHATRLKARRRERFLKTGQGRGGAWQAARWLTWLARPVLAGRPVVRPDGRPSGRVHHGPPAIIHTTRSVPSPKPHHSEPAYRPSAPTTPPRAAAWPCGRRSHPRQATTPESTAGRSLADSRR